MIDDMPVTIASGPRGGSLVRPTVQRPRARGRPAGPVVPLRLQGDAQWRCAATLTVLWLSCVPGCASGIAGDVSPDGDAEGSSTDVIGEGADPDVAPEARDSGTDGSGCDESCSDLDGWYDVGDSQPCCHEGSHCLCREQVYRLHACQAEVCVPTATETRTATEACESCDDGNPCTTDGCVVGACEGAELPAGTPCGDDRECDGDGRCAEADPVADEGWYTATPVGPVATDVFSWPQTIVLLEVQLFLPSPNPGRWQIAFPCTKPTPWEEVELAPGNLTVGNWWLIQRVGDEFYATTMDYFRRDAFCNLWAPDIFWEHLSPSEPRVAPMTYVSGQTYGLMVTTPARVTYRTTNERSNILLFTMP